MIISVIIKNSEIYSLCVEIASSTFVLEHNFQQSLSVDLRMQRSHFQKSSWFIKFNLPNWGHRFVNILERPHHANWFANVQFTYLSMLILIFHKDQSLHTSRLFLRILSGVILNSMQVNIPIFTYEGNH